MSEHFIQKQVKGVLVDEKVSAEYEKSVQLNDPKREILNRCIRERKFLHCKKKIANKI